MKVLILCAGYATRMYPLTMDRPKALLPVAGRPVVEYILANFEQIPEIDKIYIVTNAKHLSHFEDWVETYCISKEIQILSDGTASNDTRLGAIGDIQFTIEKASIQDDLIVVAGDNLFNFDISEFIRFFKERGTSVAVHHISNKELLTKYNEIKLDKQCRVVSFVEKPLNPQSTLAAICMYLFPGEKLRLIREYLRQGNNPDQPGRYIQWLHKREDVFGYKFSGVWYDIGDLEQYNLANEEYDRLRHAD